MTEIRTRKAWLPLLLAAVLTAAGLAGPHSAAAYGVPRVTRPDIGVQPNVVPTVIPQPELGIENLPITPENVFVPELPQSGPTGGAAAPDPAAQQGGSLIDKAIAGGAKFGAIQLIKYIHPGVGTVVWVGDKVITVFKITNAGIQKLERVNNEYNKALIGSIGSNAVVPEPNPVDMAPSMGMGGGGPQELHTQGVW